MLPKLQTHWRKISTGVLLAALLGAGGVELHSYLTADCCQPGAACCQPGAACCKHGGGSVAQR